MYSAKVLDLVRYPQRAGKMHNPDGVGRRGSPGCGEAISLYIKVEGGRIKDSRFQALGCPAAIATSCQVACMVVGKSLEEAEAITDDEILVALDGLPDDKLHFASMAQEVIRAAIEDFRSRITVQA